MVCEDRSERVISLSYSPLPFLLLQSVPTFSVQGFVLPTASFELSSMTTMFANVLARVAKMRISKLLGIIELVWGSF